MIHVPDLSPVRHKDWPLVIRATGAVLSDGTQCAGMVFLFGRKYPSGSAEGMVEVLSREGDPWVFPKAHYEVLLDVSK